MLKKWLTACCICILGLYSGAAAARDISFQLRDVKGPVTEKSYPGQYLLLTIGYTSCPDICPTTLYEFGQAMKAIQNPGAIQPIFVTIDPVNDDAARLDEYARFFDPRIAGLTGEMKDIEALAKQLGATFGYRLDGKKVDKPEKGMGYTVYHSSLVYLIGPDRKLHDVYDYQIGAKGLTAALDKVLGPAPSGTQKSKAAAKPASAPALPVSDKNGKADKSDKTSLASAAQQACPLPDGFTETSQGVTLKDVMDQPPAGKLTLLNVWALWCAPCRVELPLLDQLAASQKDLKVQTLNLGDKAPDIAILFTRMNLKNLPQTGARDSDLLKRLGARGLPYTALFLDGRQIAAKGGLIDKTDSIAAYAQCMAKL